ncbi:MAG TPA: hypothetical protein VG897_06565 [Terriglobales bacterium]|nr:hypothetical protein [Terriglobales bacterium]
MSERRASLEKGDAEADPPVFRGRLSLRGKRAKKHLSPADVFQKNPQAVIDAARSDFELTDERW